MKTIFAIDPGPEQSAYLYLNAGGDIIRPTIESNEALLGHLCDIKQNGIALTTSLVIEQIASFGMPVGAEVFETVYWTGRFAQAFGGQCHRIKRHEVKMHLCHNMRAKDANIRQALIDRFGKPGTKKNPGKTYGIHDDIWSALAIAVTFMEAKTLTES